jgi:hypothetical protein
MSAIPASSTSANPGLADAVAEMRCAVRRCITGRL